MLCDKPQGLSLDDNLGERGGKMRRFGQIQQSLAVKVVKESPTPGIAPIRLYFPGIHGPGLCAPSSRPHALAHAVPDVAERHLRLIT